MVIEALDPDEWPGPDSYRLRIPNNQKSTIFNGYRHRRIDVEPCLFQPGTFEKQEWSDAVTAVGLAFQCVVPVTSADFQFALFHDVAPCAYFELKAMGGQEVRNSHKNCSGYFPKVLYSPDLPTLTGRFSGTKIPRLVRVAVRPACGSFDAPYEKVYFDFRCRQCVQCSKKARKLLSYTYLSYCLRLIALAALFIVAARLMDKGKREI